MSDAAESPPRGDKPRRLSDAIREVKNAAADRGDVVVELREAERMRLELLAQELAPVFAEVPAEESQFDFAISSGLQPRLWIDATSHVAMGRDKRTYRFLRDTRLGRVVLAESTDMKPVADQVTLYIAERMVERQRLMEGEVAPVKPEGPAGGASIEFRWKVNGTPWGGILSGIGLFFAGVLAGAATAVFWFWETLAPLFAAG